MSMMTYIRPALPDELATVVRLGERSKRDSVARQARSEIGPSVVTIVASVLIMAALMAFRLWWLMPASMHFQT